MSMAGLAAMPRPMPPLSSQEVLSTPRFDDVENGATPSTCSDADLPALPLRRGDSPTPKRTRFGGASPVPSLNPFYDELSTKLDGLRASLQEQVRRLDEVKEALAHHVEEERPPSTAHNGHQTEPMAEISFADIGQQLFTGEERSRSKPSHTSMPSAAFLQEPAARTSRNSPLVGEGSEALFSMALTKPLSPQYRTRSQVMRLRDELAKEAGVRSTNPEPARRSTALRNFLRNPDAQLVALETIMGVVIVINCMAIGISIDVGERSDWLVVDGIFASLFFCETAYKLRLYGIADFLGGIDWRWNMFELALVCLAWGEWIFNAMGSQLTDHANLFILFRIFRLFRITRLLRVLRFAIFNDLKVMLMGTLGGMRTLLWSAVLIFWPLYMVCLFFRETLGDMGGDEIQYFKSVPIAFFTLFRCVVVGDCSDRNGRPLFVLVLEKHGWGYAAIYCCLQMFMVFGLFNVIIALYVENVVAAAKSNEQMRRKSRLRDREFFNTKMYDFIDLLWAAWQKKNDVRSGELTRLSSIAAAKDPAAAALERIAEIEITQDLFDEVLRDAKGKEILHDLDVSDNDQLDLFGVLDADGSGAIELHELREGIARLRGEARRGDIVSIRALVEEVLQEVRNMHPSPPRCNGSTPHSPCSQLSPRLCVAGDASEHPVLLDMHFEGVPGKVSARSVKFE